MRELGWWLEVTTLVIPGHNDSPEELRGLAGFIASELGPETPWHISRFHPEFLMPTTPPTPVHTLEMAWDIGRSAGLEYVYVGNLPGGQRNDTICPGCGKVVAERQGYAVKVRSLEQGLCGVCGTRIPGKFAPS
jgi:pyruvate formate lyase activating enzyme